jgi:hypothetical protein
MNSEVLRSYFGGRIILHEGILILGEIEKRSSSATNNLS